MILFLMSKELIEAEQRYALYAVNRSYSQEGEQGGAIHVIPTDKFDPCFKCMRTNMLM
jgi:hypothetical protein